MKVNNFNFINQYINNLQKTLKSVDQVKLIKGKDLILKKIKEKRNIYICGNGGSSSISNHLLVILTRGLSTLLKEKF